MSAICSCAGHLTTLIPKNSIDDYLKTLASVANYFKMPLLLETVNWMISISS